MRVRPDGFRGSGQNAIFVWDEKTVFRTLLLGRGSGTRTLEIFGLGTDGRYTRARAGEICEVPGGPGLSFNLSGLWAETERLTDE